MVIPVDSPPGLLEFLCQRFPRIGPGIWRKRLLQGRVLDARHQPLPVDAGCHGGQVIYYFRELEHEPQVPFREDILFENEHLVVVDKPHFLATAPVGNYVEQTVLHRLQQRLQLPELTPVHRLDRLTAGVLLLCKQPHERDTYQALFRRQQVDKVYEALAAPLPHCSFLICGAAGSSAMTCISFVVVKWPVKPTAKRASRCLPVTGITGITACCH